MRPETALEKVEDLAAQLGGSKEDKASISRRDRARRIDRLDNGSNSYQTMEPSERLVRGESLRIPYERLSGPIEHGKTTITKGSQP
ncbi:MAG: hypothetical protein EA424_29205 [Planctomycetaceae bacterium]|nr:MAG: hypothetical protein EA424_29205 [Planctomycetaceae bacterium]